MKKLLLLSIMLVVLSTFVYAVCTDNDGDGFNKTAGGGCGTIADCNDNNASILPPYAGMNPTGDITLCKGTYSIAVTGIDSVINIGNNIKVFCNDTIILGGGDGAGVQVGGATNPQLYNCRFSDFNWAILSLGGGTNGAIIQGNNFAHIFGDVVDGNAGTNLLFKNNHIYKSNNLINTDSNGLIFSGNNVSLIHGLSLTGNNTIIANNTFGTTTTSAITINGNNSDIYGNVFKNSIVQAITSGTNKDNFTIYNNTFRNFSVNVISIGYSNNANISIYRNTFDNFSSMASALNLAENNNLDLNFRDNEVNKTPFAVLCHGTDNIEINNNTITNPTYASIFYISAGGGSCNSTTIKNNLIIGGINSYGISISNSNNNNLTGNTVLNSPKEAIYLTSSNNSIIKDNNVTGTLSIAGYYTNLSFINFTKDGISTSCDASGMGLALFLHAGFVSDAVMADNTMLVNKLDDGSHNFGVACIDLSGMGMANYVTIYYDHDAIPWDSCIDVSGALGGATCYFDRGTALLATGTGLDYTWNSSVLNSTVNIVKGQTSPPIQKATLISYYGIKISNSYNNLIYNNFLDNTVNAYDDRTNDWNTTKTLGTNIIGGAYIGGNYWSDYTYNDTDNDSIGNTPYVGVTFIDFLPLINRYTPLTTPCIATPCYAYYVYKNSNTATNTVLNNVSIAIGEITTNWFSLLITIAVLSIIIGMIVASFVVYQKR